jgi:proteasome assembly chaperone (PAC2) family protein
MEHVRWLADPAAIDALQHPVVIAAFTGWNDAGDAASTAVRTLIESTGAKALAEIDPEPFTDFATVRPHVRLDGHHHRQIVWPTVGIWSASLPGTDVIFVLGPEPALRWRAFSEQVMAIAARTRASLVLTLGALLADVPHTRAVQLVGTATDLDLIDRFDLSPSRYEGPTGIVGVLQYAFNEIGTPSASLWAAVPGYASQIPSPKAAAALVDRACTMIGTPTPASALSAEARIYDARLTTMVNEDQDLELYVARLESMVDEMDLDDEDLDLDLNLNLNEASEAGSSSASLDDDPDALVHEVEQFLREHDGET